MASSLPRDIVRTCRKHAKDISPHIIPSHLTNIYSPGVQLNNIAFENRHHRKIHVEVAHIGMVKHVHSTFYPRPQFDAPILTLDLITVGNTSTYALFDPSPVTNDLSLPYDYNDALKDLQAQFEITPTPRKEFQPWGREILSRQCVFRRQHIDQPVFCAYVLAAIAMHLDYCKTLDPSPDYRRIRENQSRYCRMQLKNDRIRSTLTSAFGGNLQKANEYMNVMLFDC